MSGSRPFPGTLSHINKTIRNRAPTVRTRGEPHWRGGGGGGETPSASSLKTKLAYVFVESFGGDFRPHPFGAQASHSIDRPPANGGNVAQQPPYLSFSIQSPPPKTRYRSLKPDVQIRPAKELSELNKDFYGFFGTFLFRKTYVGVI